MVDEFDKSYEVVDSWHDYDEVFILDLFTPIINTILKEICGLTDKDLRRICRSQYEHPSFDIGYWISHGRCPSVRT